MHVCFVCEEGLATTLAYWLFVCLIPIVAARNHFHPYMVTLYTQSHIFLFLLSQVILFF